MLHCVFYTLFGPINMFLVRAISGKLPMETNTSGSGTDDVVEVESGEDMDNGGNDQYEEKQQDVNFQTGGNDGDANDTSAVPSFCEDDCSTIAASNLTRTQPQHGEEQQQWQSPQRLLVSQRIQEGGEEEEPFESRFASRNNVGVLITYGIEQWASVPALLLLCPFAGLMTILIFLSEEDWNWKTCLVSRNVRRIVYGFQCAAFSSLMFVALEVQFSLWSIVLFCFLCFGSTVRMQTSQSIGLIYFFLFPFFYYYLPFLKCAGDRIVYEAFLGAENTMATRMFQKEHAFLILMCGIGIMLIHDTVAVGTSIFATAFGTYMVYVRSKDRLTSLPRLFCCCCCFWNSHDDYHE